MEGISVYDFRLYDGIYWYWFCPYGCKSNNKCEMEQQELPPDFDVRLAVSRNSIHQYNENFDDRFNDKGCLYVYTKGEYRFKFCGKTRGPDLYVCDLCMMKEKGTELNRRMRQEVLTPEYIREEIRRNRLSLYESMKNKVKEYETRMD